MSTLASPEAALVEKLKRATLLSRGFTSDVYAWGERQVLKLFHSGVSAAELAAREYNVTRSVYAAGLPAPAPYELVAIEGRPGIIFERVDGMLMFTQVQARPVTGVHKKSHLPPSKKHPPQSSQPALPLNRFSLERTTLSPDTSDPI